MADAKLRSTGTLLLALAALFIAVSIATNTASPQSRATLVAIAIGVPCLLVGAIAWIVGRVGRTASPDLVNPRLRRWGSLFLVIGLVTGVAGLVGVALTEPGTLPRDVTQVVATSFLWVAIAGIVIVALSHRERFHPSVPATSDR